MKPDPAHFITAQDAATSLGCDRKTVAKAINLGQMPGYRIGTQYRIPVEAWNAFKAGEWKPQPVKVPIPFVATRQERAS